MSQSNSYPAVQTGQTKQKDESEDDLIQRFEELESKIDELLKRVRSRKQKS